MANPREHKPVLHSKKHIARLERERRQTHYILAGFIGIVVVVLGLLVYGYVDMKYLQPRRPVAEVAGVALRLEDWQARVRMERRRLISQVQLYEQYQQYLGMDLSAQQQQLISQLNAAVPIGQTVLDAMIEEELIRQEAAARGLVAGSNEVQQAVQASFQYFPLGTPTASVTPTPVVSPTLSGETLALVTITPTPTAFMIPTSSPTSTPDPLGSSTAVGPASLTAPAGPSPTPPSTNTPPPTSTPITRQGYDEAYRNSVDQLAQDGLSEAELRQLYEVDILRGKLMDQIVADVPHTQEQVWGRHILVADGAIAEVVRARLERGEDFAKLAAEVSTDTSNKDRGGDLGWFGKGAMVPEFEAAAFSLKVGDISQPVQTQFGYHIIQVLAHGEVPLDANAYERARQSVFDTWVSEARTKYGVVVYDTWRAVVPTDPAAPAPKQ